MKFKGILHIRQWAPGPTSDHSTNSLSNVTRWPVSIIHKGQELCSVVRNMSSNEVLSVFWIFLFLPFIIIQLNNFELQSMYGPTPKH